MSAPQIDLSAIPKIKPHIELWPHQHEDIGKLMLKMNSINASCMGAGKTLENFVLWGIDFVYKPTTRVLVIAPKSLMYNWASEMDALTEYTYLVVDGSKKKRDEIIDAYATGGIDVLVASYSQLHTHLSDFIQLQPDIVVFDEAHYIKTHNSKRTRAAIALALRTPRVFCVTGTPVLNWPDELWSLLHSCKAHLVTDDETGQPLYPEVLKYWGFLQRFVKMGGFQGKQKTGIKNEGRLQEILGDYMVRREKESIGGLPDKIHMPVWVELNGKQRAKYNKAAKDYVIELGDDDITIDSGMTLSMRLLQICSGMATLTDGEDDSSAKLDAAIEIAERLVSEGEHTIIFTQFRKTLEAVENRLAKLNIKSYALHGGVPADQRVPVVNEWEADEPSVCVAMLQVAGVGLNMTKSSSVIFMDKLFVPGLNQQAVDRVHRIGQNDTVRIYDILAKDTVEEDKEVVLARKQGVFDVLVSDTDFKRRVMERTALRAKGEL